MRRLRGTGDDTRQARFTLVTPRVAPGTSHAFSLRPVHAVEVRHTGRVLCGVLPRIQCAPVLSDAIRTDFS